MLAFRVIDEWAGGVGWIAHPDESMQRASHVIDGEDGMWLVDPVDVPGLDEWLDNRGRVVGVIVSLDRHKRDADAIATRHGVRIHLPEPVDSGANAFTAETTSIEPFSDDTGWQSESLIDRLKWREAVLVSSDERTIRVAEAVGTTRYMRAPGESLGVHPMLRLTPPAELRRFKPDRLLVGHGQGIMADAGGVLSETIAHSRRRTPGAYLNAIRTLF